MNILVSGATGLVGTHLCQKLKRHNIYKVSRAAADYPINIANQGKLHNAFKTKSIDAIIHLANPPDWHSQDPTYYVPTNVVGTLNLIELAKRKQARFIFASSQTVYGARHVRRGLVEETDANPTEWYGLSKFLAEQYLKFHHRLTKLPVVILRPVGIFGDSDTRTLVGKFIHLAKRSKSLIIVGRGQTKRHFIHVEDVAEAIVKALRIQKGIEIFNLGSKQVISNLQLAQSISKFMSVPIVHQGKEIRLDFYLNTKRQQHLLGFKPDLLDRIKQELSE